MTVSLSINSISAHYGKTAVLQDLSLSVAAGELVSLLGSSGCGKTTTLRLVAGFLQPTSGTIKLGDRDLTTLPAHARDIGLVFQNYALFPHLTVLENVAFGLKQRRMPTQERRQKATAMLERVGLSGLGDRLPLALSGGQKQRVALARALVIEPPLLMFDEPLSNLDAKLRIDMRVGIRQLQRANGTTSLYVTHDQEEAFSISDRVAIMNAGRIMQLDTPETLYRKPANSFVARFVGFENLLPLKVVERQDASITAEVTGGARIILSQDDFGPIPDSFVLGCRADGLSVRREGNGLPAVLGTRTYLGRAYQYQCETAAGTIVANGALSEPMAAGSSAVLAPVPEQCCILEPEG
ncbi:MULTISPECIES: ABC transporter ATP-binding protein [Rhizobium]|uniref:ABC transporter ATP-binding protein n=1 Tax=Rhizobium tropici TaxID=398 RepID=A0A6P1CG99_RHITR|nr:MULTISPECIES: ABC transporter ATP-binding protein [Rhizobium]AGB69589.1 ABC transporter, ATP-binding protein [Rhizobium tropici CIAT 899]MBB4243969.1 putative spermidine/putrescine transport system ATP-binding protein [Rhizobium tropici]MBB5595194.1 putative spermidine/putrescine transport system ATP-binding protein [Rhizobium tropici]MBB6494308.1 putative spermidine/putrescine transport system ATP-binding protein [Rhizobium tropici]NEV15356.1 ABC transporter ATP-binding protein [Rhizobium 